MEEKNGLPIVKCKKNIIYLLISGLAIGKCLLRLD